MAVDFITLSELVDESISIIKADDAINDYIRDEFYGELKIYDSVDVLNMPSIDDCPMIIFNKISHAMGEAQQSWIYTISAEFAIENEKISESTDGTVVTQDGVGNAEKLGYLIYDALRLGMPCNGNLDRVDMQLDTDSHPMYSGGLLMQFTILQPIGGTPVLGI